MLMSEKRDIEKEKERDRDDTSHPIVSRMSPQAGRVMMVPNVPPT